MLEAFFGSKARVKIMKSFLLNTDGRFYLRQLARELKLQLNSVRRELQKMEQSGLIESIIETEKQMGNGDKKYYRVNKKFILYPELKALLIKDQIQVAQSCVTELRKSFIIDLFILTGIFTDDLFAPVDLLIVGKIPHAKFIVAIKKLERDGGRELRFTLLNHKEFIYRRQIGDAFVDNILNGQNIVLINNLLPV